MGGHQDLGMDPTVVLLCRVWQRLQIQAVIVPVEQAGRTVVPALYDMLGEGGDIDTGQACQWGSPIARCLKAPL